MRIVLLRHGIAEDMVAGSNRSDPERQLTKQGRKQMKLVSKGLRRIVGGVDLVACSPYVRTVQTAEILLKELNKDREPEFRTVNELRPGGSPEDTTEWLAQQEPVTTLILVGHEPDCSRLMGYLTTSTAGTYARFSKAGACLIRCDSTPGAAQGELIWLLAPAMFKWLGV